MSEAAATPSPATTEGGGATAATTTTQTPAATPTPASDWTSGLSDDAKAYVQTKGFKDVSAVLESYRNFEKTMGVPADQLIRLPKDLSSPEGRAIFERLGAPKDAAEYKIEIPKEHGGEEIAPWIREQAAKGAWTHTQVENFVKAWNEKSAAHLKQESEQTQLAITDATNNLKKEWGNAFDQNIEIANRAAFNLGIDENGVTALGQALGRDKAMMLLHKLGKATGEATFISGTAGGGVMAPGAALAEIDNLKKDPGFAKRLAEGDAAARQQLDKLFQQAYPT